ncbi:uncharacterized protein EI97DRAFT_441220 [Westerdykella ornata]|uniref:USP domain-containing protein n=1 Tax=Westerdykella ornata TaxID=318751 RepID=A0A6A6JNU1_WESOR|nr:uncharacterized protein EI97DRAFT_441220 [Westerdykella ornata]KAF2277934.1 hypothetical protein EI97DRAFT_441220 [Westerdykella ornata]
MSQPAAGDRMESAVPDEVTATPSPPPRNPLEDEDSTLTRKRRRLDSAPAEQLVEMTIRSQPPSSPQPLSKESDAPANEHPGDSDTAAPQGDGADSPAVIPIDDDDDCDSSDTLGDYQRGDDLLFRRFPFASTFGDDCQAALAQMINHIQAADEIDPKLLPQLSDWLSQLPSWALRPAAYQTRTIFWADFDVFVGKVLSRKQPYGRFCRDALDAQEIVYSFLKCYVILCARILRAEADMLSQAIGDGDPEPNLIGYKYIRHLQMLFRPEGVNLFTILGRDYGADIPDLVNRLWTDFLESPTNGLQHLLADVAVIGQKASSPGRNSTIYNATPLWSYAGRFLHEIPGAEGVLDRNEFCRAAVRYFWICDNLLQDPSNVTDVAPIRDIISGLSELLADACQWDRAVALDFVKALLPSEWNNQGESSSGSSAIESLALANSHGARSRPALVCNAWRFKLLKRYLVKGKMELRVMSISAMDQILVHMWKAYNQSEEGMQHPVLQYLAQFLLDEQIIDYIISVESHPQLICRSGNIVGFLVVSHRFSEEQADAIWRSLSNSQDPRVVSAILAMLRQITNLMRVQDLLYLSNKLYNHPVESYTIEMLRFNVDIYERLRHNISSWPVIHEHARPWDVAIRMIQETGPSRDSTKQKLELHREACEQLEHMSASISERHPIYDACAKHIAEKSPKATGSIRAINIIWKHHSYTDSSFFRSRSDIVTWILNELCSFIEAEARQEIYQLYPHALEIRLDMLRSLVSQVPEAIPRELYIQIWDHTVGRFAFDNRSRDRAWQKFTDCSRSGTRSRFCKELIMSYIPGLDPQYYTHGMFDFVACFRFPSWTESPSESNEDPLQIPGADLLWQLMMKAPPGTIEDKVADLLAARYVKVSIYENLTVDNLEAAHVALAGKCANELLKAHRILRSGGLERPTDAMDVGLSEDARKQTELRLSRTVLLQKILLKNIRERSAFRHSQALESDDEPMETEDVVGEPIEITYNATNSTSRREKLLMGIANTVQELEHRLCRATGFTKVNIFSSGRKINSLEQLQAKLAETTLTSNAHILVQKAAGSASLKPHAYERSGTSAFEAAVLAHFEELFACMDSDDHVSQAIFDLLMSFPYRDRFADDIMYNGAPADSIFPPGKIFQAEYAAHALLCRFRERLRKGAIEDPALLNCVRILDGAILNPRLMHASFSGKNELHLAEVLVRCLLELLKERPPQEISSQYFSDPCKLVDRLITLIHVAMESSSELPSIAWTSYATILEASLHSNVVWTEFVSRSNISPLHQLLLLTDKRQPLREQVAQSIASVCGGDLPSTSALTKKEIVERFWSIISSVLPAAVEYTAQSPQLFTLAELVFRAYDETSRNEASLKSCLQSWGALLSEYRHEEFVGRDEVDHVVLGFTKLLLCCVSSIKSFKKSLNAIPLAKRLYERFLFVPRLAEIPDGDTQSPVLPVLESGTRMELYSLILALIDDRVSYDALLDLAEDVAASTYLAQRPYGFDRTNEIRSPTGYVGLLNPRAICYMNSLLTQLFMNVNFRKFVLGLRVSDFTPSLRLLSETQRLFAEMQNSYRKSADPRAFASCLKDIEGLPIDIAVQMDADEFYNLLFDQWEAQMLSPQTKRQFRSFYGGQTMNQIKSKECNHVSERVESFFVVQCDVQGKASLLDSLQAFVEGDVMEGDNKYKCESCGGKFVDAVKRTCLKDVPDNLIFHLKRFDYDLVEMTRTKVNDYFHFPMVLDVSPYKVEYLGDPSKPRKEDIFELSGVLVHYGTADNGHYFSYIRERPCPSGGTSNWFEFNDRDVGRFEPADIPKQAFGGFFEDAPQMQKPYSAYMLFYQRKTAIEKDQQDYSIDATGGPIKVSVPLAFKEAIDKDNQDFIREYCLHDPGHTSFVRQMLTKLRSVNEGACSEDHVQESQTLHMALEHLYQILPRQRNCESFEELLSQLRRIVLSCANCSAIALERLSRNRHALSNLLLQCPYQKVRAQSRALLVDCLQFLREKDPSAYFGTDGSDSDEDVMSTTPSQGVLFDMAERLCVLSAETYESPRGWEDVYHVLCELSGMGSVESALLLRQGLLGFCLRTLGLHASPTTRSSHEYVCTLMEKRRHILTKLIEFVSVLLSHLDIRLPPLPASAQHDDRFLYQNRALHKFPLTVTEKSLLLTWDQENSVYAVLDKIIEVFDSSRSEVDCPGRILEWMLQSEEHRIRQAVFFTMSEGITLTVPYSDPYVKAAVAFCEACPNLQNVHDIIGTIATNAATLKDAGGEAHIYFLSALPTMRNMHAPDQGHPSFYHTALLKCRIYSIPLLLYEDEEVRAATATHVYHLTTYGPEEGLLSGTILNVYYTTLRRMALDMIVKLRSEHRRGTSRAYADSLLQACRAVVQQFGTLLGSNDPHILNLRVPADDDVMNIAQELEELSRAWSDDLTPFSTGGELNFRRSASPIEITLADLESEQSDFGSESDDAVEAIGS